MCCMYYRRPSLNAIFMSRIPIFFYLGALSCDRWGFWAVFEKTEKLGQKEGNDFFQFFVSWLVAYSYNGVLSEILAKNNDFFDFFQKYLWFSINRCFRQKVQILGVEFNSKWDTGNRVQVSLFNFSCEISFILVIQPCFGAFPAFLDDLCKVLYGGSSWPPVDLSP